MPPTGVTSVDYLVVGGGGKMIYNDLKQNQYFANVYLASCEIFGTIINFIRVVVEINRNRTWSHIPIISTETIDIMGRFPDLPMRLYNKSYESNSLQRSVYSPES